MAFGQQSGPTASAKQVQTLQALVVAAGHADLRDARGPLGLTQRQAAGKFTRDEADALIARLEREAELGPSEADEPIAVARRPAERAASPPAAVPAARAEPVNKLRTVPSAMLAAELQRRGWVVMEP